MKVEDRYILDLGALILRCKKVEENEWSLLSIVYDTNEGHTANSGFLYLGEKVRSISVSIENEPLLLRDKIIEFREKIFEQCGQKFKQLLIQMEKETGRIKIDFEFDDPDRWAIKPAKLKEMREALKPQFD
jgi:hypothetical protein